MAQIDSFQVSFQKRSVAGLDQYEHEQASVTANVTLDDGDNDYTAVCTQTADAVRSQVRRLLGLSADDAKAPSKANTTVNEAPPKAEAGPNEQIKQAHADAGKKAPADTEGPKDENGNPKLPDKTNSVRGDNARKLAEHLEACHDHGLTIPSAQINRLPKGWITEVTNYIKNNPVDDGSQESAGSHDDPPPSGPDVDEQEATQSSSDDDDDLMSDGDDDDDLMGGSEPEQQFEDISDEDLQARLRQFKQRLGGTSAIKELITNYAGQGKGASAIEKEQRPNFLKALEGKCKEAGV